MPGSFCYTLLTVVVCTSTCLAQCNAPDGFWEQYNAEAEKANKQPKPATAAPPSGGCSIQNPDHGHSHDHKHAHHHHGRQANQKSESDRNMGPEHKDYQGIIDQIERESHGRDDDYHEPFFSEQALVYVISGVFGFVVLIPFWLPVLAVVFGGKKNKSKSDAPRQTPLAADGWFSEISSQWPGQALSFKVDQVLHEAQSKHQHIAVYRTSAFGTVLTLDGVVQLADRDEFAYHEMLTHIPMAAHGEVKSVLILGGGDGGVLREVLKYPNLKKVVLCEVDEAVIQAAKNYFAKWSGVFDDPRVTLKISDAKDYVASLVQGDGEKFDVVLCDSTDPTGAAASLFTREFYTQVKKLLTPNGVLCVQSGSIWLNIDWTAQLRNTLASLFKQVKYASIQVPTYPSGQIGILVATNSPRDVSTPNQSIESFTLRAYTAALHSASFAIPRAFQNKLNEQNQANESDHTTKPSPVDATQADSPVTNQIAQTTSEINPQDDALDSDWAEVHK